MVLAGAIRAGGVAIQNPKSKIQNRLLFGCLLMAAGLFALSVPLRCMASAEIVGGAALGGGALFGLSLAAVTRTRRTSLIYFFLLCAALTLGLLIFSWPPADSELAALWRGAPSLFSNYFDVLRPALFLLGLPYPFARFGQHSPDAPSS